MTERSSLLDKTKQNKNSAIKVKKKVVVGCVVAIGGKKKKKEKVSI